MKASLPFPIEELDGIPCIKKKHLMEYLDQIQLIDVRTQEEFEAGSIPGALHIPMGEALSAFLDQEQEKDKEKVMIFYCHRGGRSGKATLASRDRGFTRTFSLAGGFLEWGK